MRQEEIDNVVKNERENVKYYNVLCNNNYPTFINKYLSLKLLKRIDGIGQFCGQNYNGLDFFKMLFNYSRLNHSIACACIIWNQTFDKTQTLLALFHDIGTLSFSHCVDFMLGDTKTQESSEKNIYELMIKDKEVLNLLQEDSVNVEVFKDLEKYPLVENTAPKLCVDRLEGIFSTCYVWRQNWELKDIQEIIKYLTIGINEDNDLELAFNNVNIANKFMGGMNEYALALQMNEDKLSMNLIGDILNLAISYDVIKFEDLYILSEEEIINKIKLSGNRQLNYLWNSFAGLKKIYRCDNLNEIKYCKEIISKKRYVNPLVQGGSGLIRLTEVSDEARNILTKYLEFADSKYAYFDIDTVKVKKLINK